MAVKPFKDPQESVLIRGWVFRALCANLRFLCGEGFLATGGWRLLVLRCGFVPSVHNKLALALLLAAIAATLVLPIWLVDFPPLLDYPNHLARTFVLTHLHDPAYHFEQYYRADWGLYPYLGMDLIVIAIEKSFHVEQSGRIFLSILVLAVPLSAWFFVRRANRGEDALAAWVTLAAYNVFFLEGFLNFCLSMALGFLALGLWLRAMEQPRLGRWLLAFVAFLALYFTHLLGFGIAGLVAAGYLLFSRPPWRQWWRTGLMFAPMVALYLYWSRVDAGPQGGFTFRPLREKLEALHATMHGFSDRLDLVTGAVFIAFIIAAAWRNPEFRVNRVWAGVAALLFAIYWVLPLSRGDGFDLDIRVLPVAFIVLLAAFRVGRRGRLLMPIVLLIFALRMASATTNFVGAQPELKAIAESFQIVPANARVLPIVEVDEDDPIRRPYAHFWAYGIMRRGWFAPYLFDLHGVMPLRLTAEIYTPDGFWDLSYDPEIPDWKQVQEDYDYVWAYNVERFSGDLERIGAPIYTSGKFTLYRINPTAEEQQSR